MPILGKRLFVDKPEGSPIFHTKVIWVQRVVSTDIKRYYETKLVNDKPVLSSVMVNDGDDVSEFIPKDVSMVYFCEQLIDANEMPVFDTFGNPVFDLTAPTMDYVCNDKIINKPTARTIRNGWYALGDFMTIKLIEDSPSRNLKAGALADILYNVEFTIENEEVKRRLF